MKRFIFFSIVALLGIHCILFGQTQTPTPALPTVTTPDAASFMKFIDNEVSLFNGSVDVSIPFYTLTDGSVTIPMDLRYNTTGIKVAEDASWVGLGWNLTVGGMITQVINGEEDDENSFWFKDILDTSVYKYPINWNGYTDPIGYYANDSKSYSNTDFDQVLYQGSNGYLYPDVYYFNFLNYSGKFYINPINGKVELLDISSNIRFEQYSPQNGGGFEAITPDGTVFNFTFFTTVSSPNLLNTVSSRNFYLTNIIYPDGENVYFTYTQENSYKITIQPATYYIGLTEKLDVSITPLSECTYQYMTLQSISTQNYVVTFNTADGRQDGKDERQLNSIVVTNKITNTSRTFLFSYDYFTSSVPSDPTTYCSQNLGSPDYNLQEQTKRLKLTSFGESGLPPYLFTYKDNLPIKTSYAVDYWGFYNGQLGNKSLLPDLSLFYPFGSIFPMYPPTSGCRAANPDSASAGLLTEIQYPTGGKRDFEYESNTFSDSIQFYPSINQLNKFNFSNSTAARIQDDGQPAYDVTNYQFDITQATRVRITGFIGLGSETYQQSASLPSISLYRYSTPVHVWTLSPNQTTLNIDTTITLEPISPATDYNNHFSVTAYIDPSLGDQSCSTCSPHVSAYANIQLSTLTQNKFKYCYGGGLRVKTETLWNHDNITSPIIYRYEYDTGTDTSGFSHGYLMTPLLFGIVYPLCMYPIENGGWGDMYLTNPINFHTDYGFYSNNVIPDNGYSNGAIVGYDTVIIHKEGANFFYNGINTYGQGKIITIFNNQANDVTKMENYVIGAPLFDQPLNGKISEKAIYDINDQLVHDEKYFYTTIIHPLTNQPRYVGLYCLNCNRGGLPSSNSFYGLACTYPINNYLVNLNKTTVIDEFNDTTTHYYTYNTIGQLCQDSVKNSDGSIQQTILKHPYDYTNTTGITYSMLNNNVLSPVIEKEEYHDSILVYHEYNTFEAFFNATNGYTNALIPIYTKIRQDIDLTGSGNYNKTYFYTYGQDPILQTNIDAGVVAKLREFIDKEGDTVTYIWGYNYTLPIAKIVGCGYQMVKSCMPTPEANLQTSDESDLIGTFYELRNTLHACNALAQVTSYTYDPAYGITSSTDENNVTTTYSYDTNGRLSLIRDHNGKIIKQYDYHYHYQGQ